MPFCLHSTALSVIQRLSVFTAQLCPSSNAILSSQHSSVRHPTPVCLHSTALSVIQRQSVFTAQLCPSSNTSLSSYFFLDSFVFELKSHLLLVESIIAIPFVGCSSGSHGAEGSRPSDQHAWRTRNSRQHYAPVSPPLLNPPKGGRAFLMSPPLSGISGLPV